MNIHFFPSGNADSILIQFKDEQGQSRNICIDSGLPRNYEIELKTRFASILDAGQQIDLWIITHIHDDHIGGVTKFIKDPDFAPDFVEQYWFNPSPVIIPDDSSNISVKQGINLRDYLIENKKCEVESICTDRSTIDLFGGKFTILSPDKTRLDAALVKWKKEEQVSGSDYRQSIEYLLAKTFKEDGSPYNGSSIAFLLELKGKRILFLGDSYPSVVADSIQDKLGCSPENPLKLDLVKVSHHGSAGNTSPELLSLIDCECFAFCAYGKGKPSKETLIRIATSRLDRQSPTTFLFNHATPSFSDIFGKEPDARERLNFQFEYLPNGLLKF